MSQPWERASAMAVMCAGHVLQSQSQRFLPPHGHSSGNQLRDPGGVGAPPHTDVVGKAWVSRRKEGPSEDRTGSSLLRNYFRLSLSMATKYRLPESNCFLLPWVGGSASSSSRCPLLSQTDIARSMPQPLEANRVTSGPLSLLSFHQSPLHPQVQSTVTAAF